MSHDFHTTTHAPRVAMLNASGMSFLTVLGAMSSHCWDRTWRGQWPRTWPAPPNEVGRFDAKSGGDFIVPWISERLQTILLQFHLKSAGVPWSFSWTNNCFKSWLEPCVNRCEYQNHSTVWRIWQDTTTNPNDDIWNICHIWLNKPSANQIKV